MSNDQNERDGYIINTKHLKVSTALIVDILGCVMVLAIVWGLFLNQWLGNTVLGSVFQKNNYDTQYWVYLQPENAKDKNYRLKGDITVDYKDYYLTKVYWSNGGYETFSDCNLSDATVDNGSVSCITDSYVDDSSTQYTIRLGDKV
jgi:hypothetical protein